jgi:hypothetical protein
LSLAALATIDGGNSQPLDLRDRLNRRWGAMKLERSSWEQHWRDLSDYILPRRSRFFITKTNKGDKRNQNIVDSTGTVASRTLANGMMSGMSSPARPWFKLETHDLDLNEFGPVKVWLSFLERRVRQVFHASNVYQGLPTIYREMGVFGTGCAIVDDDFDDVIRLNTLTIGEYALALNNRRVVDTLYREMQMTVMQLVGDFLADPNDRFAEPDWSKASIQVKTAWDRSNYDQWVNVMHAIEPNTERMGGKVDNRNMKFRSIYWEQSCDDRKKFLRKSGYRHNPIIAPRWDVVGNDIYGSSPGMDALADIRQLQIQQKRKGEAIEKLVNPPTQHQSNGMDRWISTLPGAKNVVSDLASGGIKPVYEVKPDVAALLEDINATQERVREAFYADLFRAISQMEGVQPRNELELVERKEEKLAELGPVVERSQNEMHGPLIDRTVARLIDASIDYWMGLSNTGALPPPPPELQGMDIQVNYISLLAQAQKAAATGGIQRVAQFVAGLVGSGFTSAADKFDADQAIDEYADASGAPPTIVRSDDAVVEMRKVRQQQEMAAQAAAAAAPLKEASAALKNLGETNVGGGNTALETILANMGVAPPPQGGSSEQPPAAAPAAKPPAKR